MPVSVDTLDPAQPVADVATLEPSFVGGGRRRLLRLKPDSDSDLVDDDSELVLVIIRVLTE